MDFLELFKFSILLIFSLLLLYGSSRLKKKRKVVSQEPQIEDDSFRDDMRAFFIIIIGVLGFFIITFFALESDAREQEEKILVAFSKNKALICGLGRFAKSNEGYLVSKESGWVLKGNEHFLKGDILISISSCEQQ